MQQLSRIDTGIDTGIDIGIGIGGLFLVAVPPIGLLGGRKERAAGLALAMIGVLWAYR